MSPLLGPFLGWCNHLAAFQLQSPRDCSLSLPLWAASLLSVPARLHAAMGRKLGGRAWTWIWYIPSMVR